MRNSHRKQRFIKLRARPPYLANGKTAFPELRGKSGVYLIRENGKLVYIGFSSNNIYRTMYRHFQAWHHPLQEVISYAGSRRGAKYTVSVTLCPPKTAERLERTLVIKYQPRDNANKYKAYTTTDADEELLKAYNETYITPDEEAPF